MTWHVPVEALRRYESGAIDATQQLSIEAHLVACDFCRSALAGSANRSALGRTWQAIEAELAAPAPGVIERSLLAFGVSDHSARLVAATPSLRRSWLLAIAAVLTLAVLVANGAEGGYIFFLAIAPLLPLAGIAAAFGPGIDPTYEIGIAAPIRGFRLLLIRSVAVLASTIALAAVAALFLPALDWRAGAWLLPCLAVVATALALSTIVNPLRATVWVAATWLVGVGAATWAATGEASARAVFGQQMQVAVVVVAIVAGFVLRARREELERGEHR
ncbi:MAG TPA: zf-HC2 domain-containing protein [Actinomycetota bacterium]|nr:zf-HC2 domain-containing protein [Actinomycetota bacterium]